MAKMKPLTEGQRFVLLQAAAAHDGSVKFEYASAERKAQMRGLQVRGLMMIGESRMHAWITDAGRLEAERWK